MMQSCSPPTFASCDSVVSGGSSPDRTLSMLSGSASLSPSPNRRLEDLSAAENLYSKRWPGVSNWRNPTHQGFSRPSTPTSRLTPPSSSGYKSAFPFTHNPNVITNPSVITARSRRLSSTNITSYSGSNGFSGFKPISEAQKLKTHFASVGNHCLSNCENEVTLEYLADLVKEKKHIALFPHMFNHVDRLLDDEIARVRVTLFQTDFIAGDIELPEPIGETVTITEKIYVPKKEYPDYNFVGRILGPRGMTAKQLEQETGCKIMVRGKGSMRDKKKQEDNNRGRPNWEHLDDDLHVLLQCEDTENRVHIKLRAAIEQVKKLLIPAPEGTDELKRKQLMELAIINGTYRPLKSSQSSYKSLRPYSILRLSCPTRVMTAVPLLSPIRTTAPAVLMSPSPSPTAPPSPTLPTSTTNFMNASGSFDYSAFLNSSLFETALASMQLTGDLHIPNYPTTTSFVNSFPSLFASPNSQHENSTTSATPSRSNSAGSQSSF
ncbi:unnamed protein product [Caenorhabditis auriculariae]|uniref:K Homology domain-containing protein n=1 Tax=Caenorhabditis auriculariae TaxID=2777116 RepID=A0A8S1HQR6_9PELO|nr:unnamed protein product [Caenorhabditis auriculariae]